MAPSDNEVLQTLVDVGDSLLNHLSSTDQLLALLDKLENLLSTLDQEPDEAVKEAILPSMKALISSELLRHSDEHVKISVTSCIAEITRITAPDSPYDDEQMKEIFMLTVKAFEKLSDVPSHGYEKALLIVDNVARVRSCLLMMDLECDDLIIQMFQIFLRVISPNHPEVVTFAIEAIMTMVLNESEEISTDLLSPILDSLRKENQTNSPISWSLAEKVIANCADKLQAYLMRAVQSTGRPLDAFAEIVASICQRGSETLQCNHSNDPRNPLVQEDENELSVCKGSDKQSCDDPEPDIACARQAETIDDAKLNKRNPNSTADSEIIKKKAANRQPHSDLTKNEKRNNAKTNLENGNSQSVEKSSSEAELDVMPKKRGYKPNSLTDTEEGYDHSQICMDSKSTKAVQFQKAGDSGCYLPPSESPASRKNNLQLESENVGEVFQAKVEKTMKPKKAHDRGTGLPRSKNSASQKDKLFLEPKIAGELSQCKTKKKSTKTSRVRKACDGDIELSPPANHNLLKDNVLKKFENKGCEDLVSQHGTDKNIDAAHPSTNQSTPDSSRRKRGRPRKNSNNQGANLRFVSTTEEDHLTALHEDIPLEPASLRLEKDREVMKDAEVKNRAPLRKIKVASKTDENTAVVTESIAGEMRGKTCEDEEKATPVVNIETTNVEEDQALTQTNVKKRRKLDALPNKDVNDFCTVKLTDSVAKKLTGVEETPQTRPRRKRTAGSVEAAEMRDCNELSVGSRIKVWWPKDKRFYEGVVDSYDSAKGKHKILYVDGDVEVLNLKKQRWELITDHVPLDADQEIDLQQIEPVTSDMTYMLLNMICFSKMLYVAEVSNLGIQLDFNAHKFSNGSFLERE
ncbi:sister chromatid cohesion protein PDS5 homolog E isoform X2 [Prosopis cineraria]|uniref:sister chromatid cohesion protein PDS5 homolog E isoform X2 n=1 Tax=Prosopis cineraria TaxID=364024 RepID=UPI00240FBF65|nr:sister chromatid cohesion protein PDS5 homolog E isoform X2 [Prosopis cineraria]